MCILGSVLLVDIFVVWFLLNAFSGDNWDDDKGKVLLITLVFAGGGGVLKEYVTPHLEQMPALAEGPWADDLALWSLGASMLVGGALLKVLGGVSWRGAFKAMSAILIYKIVSAMVLVRLLAEA